MRCTNNLRQLWVMQANYAVLFGGRERSYPHETGAAFWLSLSKTHPPLIDRSLADIYRCPCRGSNDDRACDYRGPSTDVNHHADEDPVGADLPDNHSPDKGGNVIQKSCCCVTVTESDNLWRLAEEKTKP